MKKLLIGLCALMSLSSFANVPFVKCEAITLLNDSSAEKIELEALSANFLSGVHNGVVYKVLLSRTLLDYGIYGLRSSKVSGIAPAPTKKVPFILRFSDEGQKHELRCYNTGANTELKLKKEEL